jgi:hypothetical protein
MTIYLAEFSVLSQYLVSCQILEMYTLPKEPDPIIKGRTGSVQGNDRGKPNPKPKPKPIPKPSGKKK